MGSNLYGIMFVALACMNVFARREIKGPHTSTGGILNSMEIKKKNSILDVIRGPKQAQNNLEKSNRISRKNGLIGFSNQKDAKTNNRFSFPFKVSQYVMLMKSEGLIVETCKASFYKRKIHSEGCISKTIQVKHCAGKCNSFYVPVGDREFRFCSHCLPNISRSIVISLRCPGKSVQFKLIPMRVIESCACQSIKSCTS